MYLTIMILEGMGSQGAGGVFRKGVGKVIHSSFDRCRYRM